MRTEVGKLLRRMFEDRLRKVFPDFILQKAGAPYFWPGERVFVQNAGGSNRNVVILSPHPNGSDSFTVEIGWSRLGRTPELSARPSVVKSTDSPFELAEFVTRLGCLEEPRWEFLQIGAPISNVDPSELVNALTKQCEPIDKAEIEREIASRLDTVFSALQRVGIPFLSSAINDKGVS